MGTKLLTVSNNSSFALVTKNKDAVLQQLSTMHPKTKYLTSTKLSTAKQMMIIQKVLDQNAQVVSSFVPVNMKI